MMFIVMLGHFAVFSSFIFVVERGELVYIHTIFTQIEGENEGC